MYCHYETINDGTSLGISNITRCLLSPEDDESQVFDMVFTKDDDGKVVSWLHCHVTSLSSVNMSIVL